MRRSQMWDRGRRRGPRGLAVLAVLAATAALAWLPGWARAGTDSPAVNVLPSPVHVEATEPVAVADSATVTPPPHAGADEAIGVTDGVTVTPPSQTPADEAVGVGESVTVRVLGLATRTTLTASADPVQLGTAVTLTARVATASGHAVPDGSVTLRDGPTVVAGPKPVSITGRVRFSLPQLPLGAHALRAVYRDTGSPTVSECSSLPRAARKSCRNRRIRRAALPYAASATTLDEGVYDYTLSLSPGDLALPRSGSGSVQARLSLAPGSATGGLPSRLTLALGGLAGKAILSAPATIAFPQSSASPTTATVHVTADSAMLGTATFTVQAGGQIAAAALHVYDYSLALDPSGSVVEQGRSTDYTVTATLTPGSSMVAAPATIPLRVSGLGAGTSGTPSGPLPFPAGGPTHTGLHVAAGSGAATGSFTLAVSGAPGGRRAAAALTVETVPIPTPTIPTIPVIPTLSTQTTLSSSANPALQGATVDLDARVTASGSAVASGTVTLKEGSTVLAGPTALDSSGQASFQLSTLAVGSHTLTAVYGGTIGYGTSSGTLTQDVSATAASTRTALSSSANPALKGATVTVTAHVTTAGGSDVTSGSVTLKEGSTVLAGPTAVDSSGQASFQLSTLALGAHTLTAVYGGAGADQGSSGTLYQGIYDYTLAVDPAYDPSDPWFSAAYLDVTASPPSVTYTVSATLVAGSATAGAPATIPLTVSIPRSTGLTESFSAPLAFPAGGTTRTTLTVTADPATVSLDINNPFLIYIDAASGAKQAIAAVDIPPQ